MESCTDEYRPQFENLCEALRGKIKSFKRENPRLSGLQIAKIFGMASSTLNRIENRSISTPSIDQVVKVLRGVGAHDELIRFMDSYYPEISDTFRNHISISSQNILDVDSMKVILEPSYFKIFILAICGDGVEESFIKNFFGRDGEVRVQTLLDKGILEREKGKIKFYHRAKLRFDNFSTKELVTRLVVDQFKPSSSRGFSTGFISASTCSVRDEGVIDEVKNILKEARDRVRSLVDDPKNKGDIKYFFTICCDEITI